MPGSCRAHAIADGLATLPVDDAQVTPLRAVLQQLDALGFVTAAMRAHAGIVDVTPRALLDAYDRGEPVPLASVVRALPRHTPPALRATLAAPWWPRRTSWPAAQQSDTSA